MDMKAHFTFDFKGLLVLIIIAFCSNIGFASHIIGGGIKTSEQATALFNAGVDVVVVGNKLEDDPDFLEELVLSKHSLRQTPIQRQ